MSSRKSPATRTLYVQILCGSLRLPNTLRVRLFRSLYCLSLIDLIVPADAPKVNYRLPGFFAKFVELQQVMWTTNAGLTDRHTFDSRPDSWPRLRRGIVSVHLPGRVYCSC